MIGERQNKKNTKSTFFKALTWKELFKFIQQKKYK